jgi:hypothetical protein
MKSDSKTIKLTVPYYSQFLDVNDAFWNIRSCGGACLKMIIDYYKNNSINVNNSMSVLDIMNYAKENDGYSMSNGFIHDFAVNFLKENNLSSYRLEGLEDLDLIKKEILNNNPIIVSVVKRVLEQTKFHLILVVGLQLDEKDQVVKVFYHDSEATSIENGSYRVCNTDQFLHSWRGKAIFVSAQ